MTIIPVSAPNTDVNEICEECCRFSEASIEIDKDILGVYYDDSRYSPDIYSNEKRYLVRVFRENKNLVEVTVRVKPILWVTDAASDFDDYIKHQKNRIHEIWSRRWKLVVRRDNCPERVLDVDFFLETVDSEATNAHYELYILKPENNVLGDRPVVQGRNFCIPYPIRYYWYGNTEYFDNNFFAHEYGHTFGLPDEYALGANSGKTVTYYGPNGEPEPPLSIPSGGQEPGMMGLPEEQMKPDENDPDKDPYAYKGSVRSRYYYPIAIEVQDLLRSSFEDPSITCDVVSLTYVS